MQVIVFKECKILIYKANYGRSAILIEISEGANIAIRFKKLVLYECDHLQDFRSCLKTPQSAHYCVKNWLKMLICAGVNCACSSILALHSPDGFLDSFLGKTKAQNNSRFHLRA